MGPGRYELVFDGGSRGNPGPAYGSFRIRPIGGRPRQAERLRFEYGTNNEAEYWSLIHGLQALLKYLSGEGTDPLEVSLEVRGDSRLVINQLKGEWKAKDQRMRALRDEALGLLGKFRRVRLVHQGREKSFEILHH